MQLTIRSLLVKCTIQPSLITFDPRRLVCFTDCTMRIRGILLLGDELSTSSYKYITQIIDITIASSSELCFYSSKSHCDHTEHTHYTHIYDVTFQVSTALCSHLVAAMPNTGIKLLNFEF